MNRRWKRALWRGFALASCGGLSSGCGLLLELPTPPIDDVGNPSEGPTGGGRAEGGVVNGGGGDASGGTGAGATTNGTGSASSGGRGEGGDGSGGAGLSDCAELCDCDGDGQEAETCGGEDCDDQDERVFRGQTKFFAARSGNPEVGFDFDCSGSIERPLSQAKVECAALSLGACSLAQGFHSTVPPCGETGSWGACEPELLTCKKVVLDSMRTATCH